MKAPSPTKVAIFACAIILACLIKTIISAEYYAEEAVLYGQLDYSLFKTALTTDFGYIPTIPHFLNYLSELITENGSQERIVSLRVLSLIFSFYCLKTFVDASVMATFKQEWWNSFRYKTSIWYGYFLSAILLLVLQAETLTVHNCAYYGILLAPSVFSRNNDKWNSNHILNMVLLVLAIISKPFNSLSCLFYIIILLADNLFSSTEPGDSLIRIANHSRLRIFATFSIISLLYLGVFAYYSTFDKVFFPDLISVSKFFAEQPAMTGAIIKNNSLPHWLSTFIRAIITFGLYLVLADSIIKPSSRSQQDLRNFIFALIITIGVTSNFAPISTYLGVNRYVAALYLSFICLFVVSLTRKVTFKNLVYGISIITLLSTSFSSYGFLRDLQIVSGNLGELSTLSSGKLGVCFVHGVEHKWSHMDRFKISGMVAINQVPCKEKPVKVKLLNAREGFLSFTNSPESFILVAKKDLKVEATRCIQTIADNQIFCRPRTLKLLTGEHISYYPSNLASKAGSKSLQVLYGKMYTSTPSNTYYPR